MPLRFYTEDLSKAAHSGLHVTNLPMSTDRLVGGLFLVNETINLTGFQQGKGEFSYWSQAREADRSSFLRVYSIN